MRRAALILLLAAWLGVASQPARAAGGSVTFAGGTPAEQATVRAALDASSFDWSLIPRTITVDIGAYGTSYATYGAVYLDATLLDSGQFSWGVVQHELAHEVDFFLLDDAKRQELLTLLGGNDWCYSVPGLKHSDYGCERFASELAWAYWPSPQNCMRPESTSDESGHLPVAQFRTLLTELIGAPTVAQPPTGEKAFAPAARPHAAPAKPKPKRP